MFQIEVSEEIRKACPGFAGVAVLARVANSPYSEGLWKDIDAFTEDYRQRFTLDSLKQLPAIQATRRAYKACGKDPSRYRPSAEALCRRILRGIPLYQIDTLVDLVNLVSIRTGYSIGGFDAGKIDGNRLVLGIGRAGEPYEGIGRGVLNERSWTFPPRAFWPSSMVTTARRACPKPWRTCRDSSAAMPVPTGEKSFIFN